MLNPHSKPKVTLQRTFSTYQDFIFQSFGTLFIVPSTTSKYEALCYLFTKIWWSRTYCNACSLEHAELAGVPARKMAYVVLYWQTHRTDPSPASRPHPSWLCAPNSYKTIKVQHQPFVHIRYQLHSHDGSGMAPWQDRYHGETANKLFIQIDGWKKAIYKGRKDYTRIILKPVRCSEFFGSEIIR